MSGWFSISQRRVAIGAVVLALSALVMLKLSSWRTPAADVKPAPPQLMSPKGAVSRAAIRQRGSTNFSATNPTNAATAVVRGLPETRKTQSLAIEVRHIDPAIDRWDTEVFNDRATKQLKKLGKWLANTGDSAPSVFAPQVRCTTLRPSQLKRVFNDAGLTVSRGGDSPGRDPRELSAKQMGDFLIATLPGRSEISVELKIIGLEQLTAEIETIVRYHSSSRDANARYQQNAGWVCRWVQWDSEAPKLASIELQEYEEIASPIASIYADRTAAIFQNCQTFANQLAYPLDYWRDRIDWRFGWQVVGPHGLAIGDVNGDGLEDLFVPDTGGLPNRLFIQQADGTLTDISRQSGVDIIEPSQSALLLDLDNDGDQDLVVAAERFLLVYENDGRANFRRHDTIQTQSSIRSLAATDYNNDRLLDIYVCGYSTRQSDSIGLGRPMPYHDANNGAPNRLLTNEGQFRFRDSTAEVGLDQNNTRFSYAAVWEDFDNDGDLDLYVANDFGRNNLYRNDGGTFHDVASEAGVEDIAAGMSVSWGDFDRDGLTDIYVGNMFSSAGNRIAYQRKFKPDVDESTRELYQRHARGNSLFQNAGDGTFRDVSQSAAVTEGRWAWSSNFLDINNDGWLDLVVANGMITGTADTDDL